MGDYTDFDEQPAEKGGGGGGGFLKFCLICGCLLLLLGGGAAAFMAYQVSQMFTMDPVKVAAKVEADILPGSKVPAGYTGMMAMKLPGVMEFAIVVPEGMQQQANQNTLPLMMMICTLPPGADPDQMKQQMQQAMQKQGQGGGANTQLQVEAEEQRSIVVHGQEVPFQEIVGAADNGVKMKQVMAVVPRAPGSSEEGLLMFMGKEDIFDQAAVDAFLKSIE